MGLGEVRGVREDQRVARDAPHVGTGLVVVRVDGVQQRLEEGRGEALRLAAAAVLVAEDTGDGGAERDREEAGGGSGHGGSERKKRTVSRGRAREPHRQLLGRVVLH